jgi:hypothetical protein
MTQVTLWDVLRRIYDREYYARNRARRRAQRLASLHGGHWRDYSGGWA